jgi:hypothetical protein
MSSQSHKVTDLVPNHQVKSHYLPSKVVHVNESDKHKIVQYN